jgi:hypothetical protein
MPKTKLGSMSVEQLLQLRDDVGKELNRKSTELREPTGEVGRGALALKMRNLGIKANDNVKPGL